MVIRNAFERGLVAGSVFRNGGEFFLSSAFIPEDLQFRDRSLQAIAQNFRPLFRREPEDEATEPFATILVLEGAAGVGKTAVGRYTVEQLEESATRAGLRVDCYYLNCWTARSRVAIIRSVLNNKYDVSSRGFSEEEVLDTLMKRLHSKTTHLVLILDEASVLSRQELQGFLLMNEKFPREQRHRISLILVSRPSEWKHVISAGLMQRISDLIRIPPYSLEEMAALLQDRAQRAFRSACISPDIVAMVAEIAHETLNLRHGIEILYRAGLAADLHALETITPTLIHDVKTLVYPGLRAEHLADLKAQELMILLGVARYLVDKDKPTTSIEHGYKSYQSECEEWGVTANGISSFRCYVRNLQALKLLANLEPDPTERRPRGRRMRITIPDIPPQLLVERIEALMTTKETHPEATI